MSALPGLLIEYLISGALALVWLVPTLEASGFDNVLELPLPLLVVGLYVLGMTVDFFAFWVVKPFKRVPRHWAIRKCMDASQFEQKHSTTYDVRFALYAPEIAKEVTMRSSRDRIARGGIVNATALIIVNALGFVDYQYAFVFSLIA